MGNIVKRNCDYHLQRFHGHAAEFVSLKPRLRINSSMSYILKDFSTFTGVKPLTYGFTVLSE